MQSSSALSAAVWRKSSRSTAQGNECVEIAAIGGIVGVRDSKDPAGPPLAMTRSAFALLSAEIRQGRHSR
ncbi:DUF397 domain-containing protein [Actinomadura nitritigenes]|uniref:DUF397 domain-containing protein n=1 Tax=Actinomadura nitritigenes TaxID=134602 RepID=UPI00368FC526